MTEREVGMLTDIIDNVDVASVEITKYTLKRFQERFKGLTMLDIAEVFLKYELIEFNTNSGDKRVLLRGTEDVETPTGCYNACIVYSIENNRIVTGWIENWHDTHETLRMEEYHENLEIVV